MNVNVSSTDITALQFDHMTDTTLQYSFYVLHCLLFCYCISIDFRLFSYLQFHHLLEHRAEQALRSLSVVSGFGGAHGPLFHVHRPGSQRSLSDSCSGKCTRAADIDHLHTLR